MSAIMARQGGRVQLEQSDMRLALNMAKMAKEVFSRAAIEELKYLIQNPRAEVQEEKNQCVQFQGHKEVKAAIQ
jgi:histone H3/H4